MSSNKALKYSLITLTWIPVVMTVNDNVCHVAKIEGSSMRPTLNASDNSVSTDWVFLWKLNCRAAHNLRRNDVILFKSPMDPSKTFCKRIKAIQYDAVQARHPYPRSVVNIPRNHLWVEGDNVYHSVDSNNFGPISAGLVVGKAIKVIWPPSRWGADLKLSTGRPNVLTVRPE
ncbi:probable Mitochondrial inner membrane protease subunit 2 [Zygosaccharomyces bailii ISA1307]|nr:probable Mitochondrial inner membrane protease subunit 2 [Zygosaccharomyces bailii ISA1307]